VHLEMGGEDGEGDTRQTGARVSSAKDAEKGVGDAERFRISKHLNLAA
jgi:hypothetical protein